MMGNIHSNKIQSLCWCVKTLYHPTYKNPSLENQIKSNQNDVGIDYMLLLVLSDMVSKFTSIVNRTKNVSYT